jgi:hypothetical protein
MMSSRNKQTLEIGFYLKWVQDSLAAHIRGEPVPPMPSVRFGGSRHLNDFSEPYFPDDF